MTRRKPDPATAPVLIVDDKAEVREVLAEILRDEGFVVRTADGGGSGIAMLQQKPTPCLVLLDLHMPGVDGWGFREAQLRRPELAEVPVLLYSGEDDIERAAGEMGLEGYFWKPFELPRILRLLRRYCATAAPE